MRAQDYIGRWVRVVMDRPLGSRHPEWDFTYDLNYGYVPGTLAPDGEPQDAYVLGVDTPIETFEGRCIAVIVRADDVEAKLVVAPEGCDPGDEAIMRAVHFQERWFRASLLRAASGEEPRPLRARVAVSLLAGVSVGTLGVAAFGVAHAVTIVPIWGRLTGGLPFAIVAGCSLAWAYQELRAAGRLDTRWWQGARFGLLLWALILPATLADAALRLADLRRAIGNGDIAIAAGLTLAVAGIAGWTLTRRRRAAIALALSALTLLMAQAGPVLVVESARGRRLFLALVVIYALGGAALGLALGWAERAVRLIRPRGDGP